VRITSLLTLGLVLIGVLFIAGCTQQAAVPPPQITPATTVPPTTILPTTIPQAPVSTAGNVKLGTTSLGKVLTDAGGMTLYFFVTDLAGEGMSTCYGTCASIWPIFSVDTPVVSPPLPASDFTSITRTDGTKQTTYKGWPLYYYKNDRKPGDMNGENVLKTWYVAKPDYTMMIASRPTTGSYLTDGTGRALYVWAKDTTPGVSSCTGTCITTWPAFSVGTLVVPSALKLSDFSTTTRADGKKQMAYMGRPLYYYSVDKDAGDLYGDGIGNVWFAANVTGVLPIPATPVTTATPATTTTVPTATVPISGGGGGGY
jgi:predicted lipoprotein with Yx(FWY)xxD motif